jgi:antitoxin VapB
MGLNIKSEEVHRLARQLANRTGTTMTAAIEAALREKVDRLNREQDVDAVVKRVMSIVRESGPTAPDQTSDHSDLYDERGLPA